MPTMTMSGNIRWEMLLSDLMIVAFLMRSLQHTILNSHFMCKYLVSTDYLN